MLQLTLKRKRNLKISEKKGQKTIEKIFESNQNAEINYSKQIEVFRINAYVTGFNSIIGEYEFETKVEGKRKLTDYYCELNSLFHILSKLGIE